MLILTRRVSESLFIGKDIAVTVLGFKGPQVRLGINAPKHTPVHREEIYDRIGSEAAKTARQDEEAQENQELPTP